MRHSTKFSGWIQANRCNQENLHAQLKSGVRALRAPLNTLDANWAYMVIVAIAWSLEAWSALMLPIAPRWRNQHQADRGRGPSLAAW